MQTFLPYPSFEASALVLDRTRLGKQRVEAWQMLLANTGRSGGWRNHPASAMWREYEAALANYALAICAEWTSRGYEDTVAIKVVALAKVDGLKLADATLPPWFGDERLHGSHRSNLLRKDPLHYGLAGWSESPDQRYYWPQPAFPAPPRRARTMDPVNTETAVAAENTVSPRQAQLARIRDVIAEIKSTADSKIGEKNIDRLGKRLDIIDRVANATLVRLEKQEKFANRSKRAPKPAAPEAAAPVAG